MVFQIIRRFPRCLGRSGYEETKRIESGEGSSKKKKRQKMLEQIKGAKEISFLIKASGSPVRVTETAPRAGGQIFTFAMFQAQTRLLPQSPPC